MPQPQEQPNRGSYPRSPVQLRHRWTVSVRTSRPTWAFFFEPSLPEIGVSWTEHQKCQNEGGMVEALRSEPVTAATARTLAYHGIPATPITYGVRAETLQLMTSSAPQALELVWEHQQLLIAESHVRALKNTPSKSA